MVNVDFPLRSPIRSVLARHNPDESDIEMGGLPCEALIDTKATAVVGAEPHERSVTRTTRRSGHGRMDS